MELNSLHRTEDYPYPEFEPVQGWRDEAACRNEDPDIFFPAKGESKKLARARAICGSCAVREECLEYALSVNEQHGVYGGLSNKQRNRIRREH